MSASIGYFLQARKPENFKELAAYATEITKTISSEGLGYDITNPDENPEKDFQNFSILDDLICWHDFSGCIKHLDIETIIDQIVHHFPETEFIYRVYWEGPLAYEAYIKGDIQEELLNKALNVGIDNPEALHNVLKEMPDAKQSGPFLVFPFTEYPVSKFEKAIAVILQKVEEIITDTELYCVIWDDDLDGGVYERKGIYTQGRILWEDVSLDEIQAIMIGLGVFNEPTEEVLGVLFKGLQVALPEVYNNSDDEYDENNDLPL